MYHRLTDSPFVLHVAMDRHGVLNWHFFTVHFNHRGRGSNTNRSSHRTAPHHHREVRFSTITSIWPLRLSKPHFTIRQNACYPDPPTHTCTQIHMLCLCMSAQNTYTHIHTYTHTQSHIHTITHIKTHKEKLNIHTHTWTKHTHTKRFTFTFRRFRWCFYPKWFTTIHTHIHTPTAVSTIQGDSQLV